MGRDRAAPGRGRRRRRGGVPRPDGARARARCVGGARGVGVGRRGGNRRKGRAARGVGVPGSCFKTGRIRRALPPGREGLQSCGTPALARAPPSPPLQPKFPGFQFPKRPILPPASSSAPQTSPSAPPNERSGAKIGRTAPFVARGPAAHTVLEHAGDGRGGERRATEGSDCLPHPDGVHHLIHRSASRTPPRP